jgi:cyclopropane fatty-acyl-phospholipid synthase-like methyltransferase
MNPADPRPLRSNLEHWKRLQERDYFEHHSSYSGLKDFGGHNEISAINMFTRLERSMRVVVIGCGYGRETTQIAREVDRVYGIDVSPVILDKAVKYLADRGVTNFTPVLADDYRDQIPAEIDLVFSVAVMQLITRDLVYDYFRTLAAKLSVSGLFIAQFVEYLDQAAPDMDADLQADEPEVTWTMHQLFDLSRRSGLRFNEARTYQLTPSAASILWHWVSFSRATAVPTVA